MRLRPIVATASAVLFTATGCDSVSIGGSNGTPPAVTIDSAAVLKTTLEAVGIQDVHPVNTADNTIAAWAVVPKFRKCPVLFTVDGQGNYTAAKLQKPDKTQVTLTDLTQPTATSFAAWALTHPDAVVGCPGDTAPAEADWPKTV